MTTNLNENENLVSVKTNPINQARLANLAKAREALALKKQIAQKDSSLLRESEMESTATQGFTRKRVQPDFDIVDLDETDFAPPQKRQKEYDGGGGGEYYKTFKETIMGVIVRGGIGVLVYLLTQGALRYAVDNGYTHPSDANSRSNQSNTTKQQLKPGEYIPGQFIIR